MKYLPDDESSVFPFNLECIQMSVNYLTVYCTAFFSTTYPAAVTTDCRRHSCLHIFTESDDIYYFSGVLIYTVHLTAISASIPPPLF